MMASNNLQICLGFDDIFILLQSTLPPVQGQYLLRISHYHQVVHGRRGVPYIVRDMHMEISLDARNV